MIITFIEAIFIVLLNFVPITIYNSYLRLGFATVFTFFATFSLILDIDLPLEQAFNYPVLYTLTQEGRYLSPKVLFMWIFKSIFQGAVLTILAISFFENISF